MNLISTIESVKFFYISKILFVSKSSLFSPNSRTFIIVESLTLEMFPFTWFISNEGFPCTMMIAAVKEEMGCCSKMMTARTHRGCAVLKVKSELWSSNDWFQPVILQVKLTLCYHEYHKLKFSSSLTNFKIPFVDTLILIHIKIVPFS